MSNKKLFALALIGILFWSALGVEAQPLQQTNLPNTSQATRPSVTTRSYDNGRTGVNPEEATLKPTNVTGANFGKLFSRPVDGQIYAQPLYIPDLTIPSKGKHNVVFVATEKNIVYAFDADDPAQNTPLWSVSLGNYGVSADGEFGTRYNGGVYQDIKPYVGITGSPVIDPATNTLYVVPFIKLGSMNYEHRLYAINILTGQIKQNVKIQGSVRGTGSDLNPNDGIVTFESIQHLQRAALLLDGNKVYVAFAGYADTDPYHGWIFGYDKTSLQQTMIFNTTPDKDTDSQPNPDNDGEGGIWMSGQGISADGLGNLYVSIGNGSWNAGPPDNGRDYGSSIIKLDTTTGMTPTVRTWFTPFDYASLNENDTDVGTTGAILIPNTQVLVTGSKSGKIYVFNRNDMGGLGVNNGSGYDIPIPGKFYQSFKVETASGWRALFSSPVVWNAGGNTGTRLFAWPVNSSLKTFKFNPASSTFNTTALFTSTVTGVKMPGGILSLSYDGTNASSGIIWATMPVSGSANITTTPGVLRAYNALTLQELWNSNQNKPRDNVGNFAKFNPPLVADGKVYVGNFSGNTTANTDRLEVYGLLVPRIIYQPISQTVLVGQNTSLSVTASGASTLTYQWYRGMPGDTTNPVAGANSATLNLTNVTQSGTYWVRVTNSAGSVNSASAVITVLKGIWLPLIMKQ